MVGWFLDTIAYHEKRDGPMIKKIFHFTVLTVLLLVACRPPEATPPALPPPPPVPSAEAPTPPPSPPPAAETRPIPAPAAETKPMAEPAAPSEAGSESREFCGSKNSDVFHDCASSCAKRITPANLVRFKDRAEAVAAGRRPCKTCKP
jgi:hypothetical protein